MRNQLLYHNTSMIAPAIVLAYVGLNMLATMVLVLLVHCALLSVASS